MEFLSIGLIALGLAADCFVVALGGSVSRRTLSFLPVFRVSLAFGLFQGLMTVLGWLAGRTVVELIRSYDHWVAFALLALVGGRMVWQSLHSRSSQRQNTDITRGWLLLTLSVATSIDALAVGLTFAFVEVSIALASATIAVVAFAATVIGFLSGRQVGHLMGRRVEVVGGLILIAIGIKILAEHIL